MISYRQIWLRADRQRQMYEKVYTAAFKRMLNRWTEQLMDGVNEGNAWRYHELVQIDKKPLENLFEALYTNVGTKFAEEAFRENKPKADEWEPVDKWTIYMRSYVKQRLGSRISSIADNSKMAAQMIIREAAEQALNDGLGTAELARMIRDALNTEMIPMNTWRALRIARTEVVGASNRGSFVGARELNVPMNKIWIATMDRRTRDTHAAVNGQSVDMSAPFNVGGVPMECPGDPDGLPEDVINCRCTLAYEVKRW